MRLLIPPKNEDPLAWAMRYDASPRLLPFWPPADGCAVVVVIATEDGSDIVHDGYIVEQPGELDKLIEDRGLFFTIPEAILPPP